VLASRRTFTDVLGLDGAELTTMGSAHGAGVARVDKPGGSIDDVDALITDRPGVVLFATYADCYPIVLWDPEKKVAGLVHAGWRGTRDGVASAAVRFMQDEYGCHRIRAGIGPGICGRCYEVGEEVAAQFDGRFLTEGSAGKSLLDLSAANRAQLEDLGVKSIYEIGICTKEHYLFPSHRRHPDGKRFGAIVGLR
jgi:YfiH family protein